VEKREIGTTTKKAEKYHKNKKERKKGTLYGLPEKGQNWISVKGKEKGKRAT